MTQKISRWWSVLLALFLSVTTPVVQAVAKFFHYRSAASSQATNAAAEAAAAALAFTVLPAPTGPPEVDLHDGPEFVFINGMLVEDSQQGLVNTSQPTSASFLGGVGYTPEMYMRVTLAAPLPGTSFLRGIAVSDQGQLHIYDATTGVPVGVPYIGGFPVTNSGQLCVAFV
jgi:hypothetical protein